MLVTWKEEWMVTKQPKERTATKQFEIVASFEWFAPRNSVEVLRKREIYKELRIKVGRHGFIYGLEETAT